METQDLLRRVRKIEIKTRGLSNHLFSGEYHSAFKGRGMSFSEVRAYQYGDDVRAIDWNVTARFDEPYIKVFEEERELTVVLLVDVSASSQFGTRQQTKRQMITEISAVLAFSAITNNDKVGVIFFTDRVEKYIPPKKGRFHILRIIREFIEMEPEGKGTDIGEALRFFNNVMKKRAIVFLFSDFMQEGYADPLKLAARRHDLVGIRIYDVAEEQLPSVGLVRIADAESGRQIWIDSSSGKQRRRYQKRYLSFLAYYKDAFLKSGADQLSIRTNESYTKALLRFFKKR